MKVVRAVTAIVLALLGCWCLFWLPVWIALDGTTESDSSHADSMVLGTCVLLFFGAAYLIQPWWRHPWRPGREGA